MLPPLRKNSCSAIHTACRAQACLRRAAPAIEREDGLTEADQANAQAHSCPVWICPHPTARVSQWWNCICTPGGNIWKQHRRTGRKLQRLRPVRRRPRGRRRQLRKGSTAARPRLPRPSRAMVLPVQPRNRSGPHAPALPGRSRKSAPQTAAPVPIFITFSPSVRQIHRHTL